MPLTNNRHCLKWNILLMREKVAQHASLVSKQGTAAAAAAADAAAAAGAAADVRGLLGEALACTADACEDAVLSEEACPALVRMRLNKYDGLQRSKQWAGMAVTQPLAQNFSKTLPRSARLHVCLCSASVIDSAHGLLACEHARSTASKVAMTLDRAASR